MDRIYQGGTAGNAGDDAIAKLLPVGNQGGFRYKGSVTRDDARLAVLYTTGSEPDWPDKLDVYSGSFTYYGDNRSPGSSLHETARQGNLMLRQAFARGRSDAEERARVPPFLLFDKPAGGRDVRFRGLLAPGTPRLSGEEELVAVWRATRGVRFQNYQAHFTVLDAATVSRSWIDEILAGDVLGDSCPPVWRSWVSSRAYAPLLAPPTITVRTREQQLPTAKDLRLLLAIYDYFADNPTGFEHFAADLWRTSESRVERIDVTRPWRDGGRDAVGDFLIGPAADPVIVEFALEAKCYRPGHTSVGVKDVSRLISRLRHRQFGVLVTTSFVNNQAYKEVREDGHPVVILAGDDIVTMLKTQGLDSVDTVNQHLAGTYARPS